MRPTLQEAFDKIWDWFVVQGHGPSYNDGMCGYRGDRGCKCNIGVLIPDSFDCRGIEGMDVWNAATIYPKLKDYLPMASLAIIKDLQGCHDSAAIEASNNGKKFIKLYVRRMREFAAEHKLTVPATD